MSANAYKEEMLFDEEYLAALLDGIKKAVQSIDMEVYIFDDDMVGQQVTTALCDAANRGVQIRLLVDGVGSIHWGGEIRDQLESHRIKTKVYHPLPWIPSHWSQSKSAPQFILYKLFYLFLRINNRNHRKICIIDHRIVFIGSANINNNLLINNTQRITNWRETSVKLLNIKTDQIQYAFDKAWDKVKKRKEFERNNADSIFLLNHSWRLRRRYYKSLLNRIAQCNQRIWVTNAYFIPDSRLLKKLSQASKRGVDVKIVLPAKPDIALMSIATSSFYSALLKSGAKIYQYLPTVLHAKTLVLDDWYSIGSSNLNYRSFKHDLEVNINIITNDAKEKIIERFVLDLSQSEQIQLSDVNNQSLLKKILARLLLLVRYWI